MGFPGSSAGKESACNSGDPSSIPGLTGEWLPTPVFLPGELHEQRSLAGYGPWSCKESDHKEGWVQAFKLWCWRRLLRVPWTARRSSQSILKEINPRYSLEVLVLKLKLKLHYFGHLMWRDDSMEKTLMLGKIEGRKKGAIEDEIAG